MKTFHGKQSVKDKYIERVKAHAKADEIVQGSYWENGKGCAVGCTIHGNDHKKYETELGIPEEIAHLEDTIFENLSNEEAKDFPLRFLEAVPVGVDLSHVIPELVIWQFEDKEHGLKNIKEVQEDKELCGFCEEVVALYKRELQADTPSQDEYQELYKRIDRARARTGARTRVRIRAWARAWTWTGSWAGTWAGTGAWARARARVGTGTGTWAWAGTWVWTGVRAERNTALADKFIELLASSRKI